MKFRISVKLNPYRVWMDDVGCRVHGHAPINHRHELSPGILHPGRSDPIDRTPHGYRVADPVCIYAVSC